MQHRILIAEDHNLLREGLRSMISAVPNFEVVGEARDGREAMQLAQKLKPDLITMDLSMPNMNGIEATLQIKRRDPQIKILAEFVHAMRQVLAGKLFLSADVSGQLVNHFLQDPNAPQTHSPWERLTNRERSIVKLVAEGCTNRVAAEMLHLSPKTVEKHRSSLMQKLGLHSATELILMALQHGWVERGHMLRFKSSAGSSWATSTFQDTSPFTEELTDFAR